MGLYTFLQYTLAATDNQYLQGTLAYNLEELRYNQGYMSMMGCHWPNDIRYMVRTDSVDMVVKVSLLQNIVFHDTHWMDLHLFQWDNYIKDYDWQLDNALLSHRFLDRDQHISIYNRLDQMDIHC